MKKLITALFAIAAGVSVANATDLPSRKAAAAPAVSTSVFGLGGFYVGGNVGGNVANFNAISYDKTPIFVGLTAGYEWNRYVRTEATFDYSTKAVPTTSQAGQTAFVNAVVQYPIGFNVTPYAFAGVGYGWNAWGKGANDFVDDAKALYNVGGGLRYDLTKNVELDGRYRYIQAINGAKFENNHVISLGANYKF